jgi:hypothetical protein
MSIWSIKNTSSADYRSEAYSLYVYYANGVVKDVWHEICDFSGSGQAIWGCINTQADLQDMQERLTIDGRNAVVYDWTSTPTIRTFTPFNNNQTTKSAKNIVGLQFKSQFKYEAMQDAGTSAEFVATAQIAHGSIEYDRRVVTSGSPLLASPYNPAQSGLIRDYTYDKDVMVVYWCHTMRNGIPLPPFSSSIVFASPKQVNYRINNNNFITGGIVQPTFNTALNGSDINNVPVVDTSMDGDIEIENPNNGRLYTVTIQNGAITEHALDDYEVNSYQFRSRFSLEKTFDIEAFKEVDAEVRALFGWIGDAMDSNGYLNLKNSTFSAGLDLLISKEILSEAEKIRLLKPKSTFQESDIITSPDE